MMLLVLKGSDYEVQISTKILLGASPAYYIVAGHRSERRNSVDFESYLD